MTPTHPLAAAGAVLLGALLLVWPAALNGYPLLFSDTGAFLGQTVDGFWAFDKPFVYGPLLHLFHGAMTLWGPVLAQGLMLSWIVWLALRALRPPREEREAAAIDRALGRPGRGAAPAFPLPLPAWRPAPPVAHLLACAALALLTSAPWFAALLMPDAFTPVVVLGAFLLGFGRERLSRGEAWGVAALMALGIAAHLSHLPLAAALAVLVALLRRRRRPVLRAAAPLLAALVLLLGTNLVGWGKLAISPHGSVFALARLVADGPAAATMAARCPAAGWRLCAWVGRLPTDSDEFLWKPEGPLWSTPDGAKLADGPIGLAPEAGAIVAATVARDPGGVALAAARNTGRQLVLAEVGDVLGAQHLGVAIGPKLDRHFPAYEAAAFRDGAQARGLLPEHAAPFLAVHPIVLWLSVPLALFAWWQAAAAGDHRRLGLLLCVLVGLLANAFATGALSGPHDRYQARVIWLLPFAAVLALPWPGSAHGPRRRVTIAPAGPARPRPAGPAPGTAPGPGPGPGPDGPPAPSTRLPSRAARAAAERREPPPLHPASPPDA